MKRGGAEGALGRIGICELDFRVRGYILGRL